MTSPACALLALAASAGSTYAQQSISFANDRLLKSFDFDERAEGNLEAIPRHWLRIEDIGFPKFAEGLFDASMGHDAPPSFGLSAQGRNIAFRYGGTDIPAEPTNDYLIVGWIKGRDLTDARASLSAYYLDHDHLPMASTQRFSELIHGDEQTEADDGWQRVEIFLPAGPVDARWIGLTAWVVQADIWDVTPRPRRHVERKSVDAQAWFDDIRVYRLPRVKIETNAEGNVFSGDVSPVLTVHVTDLDGRTLESELEVTDMDGGLVARSSVPVKTRHDEPSATLDFSSLNNGLYRARVHVYSSAQLLADSSLVFAVVRGTMHGPTEPRRSFGILLDVNDRADPLTELALIRDSGVGAVKVPAWSGAATAPDLADASSSTDVMLFELLESRIDVTAVLSGPPSEMVRAAGAYPRPLIGLLSENPDAWREHLVRVFAPYASIFGSWQIGRDGDYDVISDSRLDAVVDHIRDETRKLTTAPYIVVPGSLTRIPGEEPPRADEVSLTIPSTIAPPQIASYVEEYHRRNRAVTSAFMEMPDPTGVDRRSGLRDWCKRLIYARYAGIRTLYVPQPWHTRVTEANEVTEPDAWFIILHTLTDLLGDATARPPVHIGPGVTALCFQSGGQTLLALWDEGGGVQGRMHELQLGSVTRQVDMWGRGAPLERTEEGRCMIRLSADPIFIPDVERWLIDFRTNVTLDPAFVELSVAAGEHKLRIDNTRDGPISGTARLTPPPEWDIKPRVVTFSIPAGGTYVEPLEIRFQRDATAGDKILKLDFDLRAEDTYQVEVPLEVKQGTKDIEAWGFTFLAGDRLIVRHRITNRASETLTLRAFAIAPGRSRQTRLVGQLLPGQTTTLEYQFRDPGVMRGRMIRLNLRDLAGPRIHNIEVEVP